MAVDRVYGRGVLARSASTCAAVAPSRGIASAVTGGLLAIGNSCSRDMGSMTLRRPDSITTATKTRTLSVPADIRSFLNQSHCGCIASSKTSRISVGQRSWFHSPSWQATVQLRSSKSSLPFPRTSGLVAKGKQSAADTQLCRSVTRSRMLDPALLDRGERQQSSSFQHGVDVAGATYRSCLAPCSPATLDGLGYSRLTDAASLLQRPGSDPAGRRSMVVCRAQEWKSEQSPYETLGLERAATEDDVKAAFRKMAKRYHPDVYDGTGVVLEEGETAESRFIRVQAAYELLMDEEQRRKYDSDHKINPMTASRAWQEWVLKKKQAFEQRGDMAASAWAEQQQRSLNLRAKNLSKQKIDPEEERRIIAKERAVSMEVAETTVKRHNLVLRKRDLTRRRAEEASKQRLVRELLALEGFELEEEPQSQKPSLPESGQ